MHFIIICRDGPEAPALRQQHLQEHLAFVESNIERIMVAGPLADAEGNFTGSVYVVATASAAAAEEFIASDPYDVAGVWQQVEIKAFEPVAGQWVGGVTW